MQLNSVPIAATFSKDRAFFANLPFEYLIGMDGARVKGSNGKWYLDWICGLGANLLGQGECKSVRGFYEYVNMHARRGLCGSLPYEVEYRAATKLTTVLGAHVPGWSGIDLQVRWVLSGSDACNAAVRLARAITGRPKVLSIGYHGWSDIFVATTPPAHGIPYEAYVDRFVFGEPVDEVLTDNAYAAVIVEQPSVDAPEGYYVNLRKWCDDNGALLIMDEVVTGLRYGLGGVCERYGVQPDLICMGKALGNGYPIAAVVGPKEYMDWFNPVARPNGDPVFVSSTNVGCTAGLAAADFILDHWKQRDIAALWVIGQEFMDELQSASAPIIGHPVRSLFQFDDDYQRAYFMRGMVQHGVLVNRPNFVCAAHTRADIEQTAVAAGYVMQEMHALGADGVKEAMQDKLPLVMFRNR